MCKLYLVYSGNDHSGWRVRPPVIQGVTRTVPKMDEFLTFEPLHPLVQASFPGINARSNPEVNPRLTSRGTVNGSTTYDNAGDDFDGCARVDTAAGESFILVPLGA